MNPPYPTTGSSLVRTFSSERRSTRLPARSVHTTALTMKSTSRKLPRTTCRVPFIALETRGVTGRHSTRLCRAGRGSSERSQGDIAT